MTREPVSLLVIQISVLCKPQGHQFPPEKKQSQLLFKDGTQVPVHTVKYPAMISWVNPSNQSKHRFIIMQVDKKQGFVGDSTLSRRTLPTRFNRQTHIDPFPRHMALTTPQMKRVDLL